MLLSSPILLIALLAPQQGDSAAVRVASAASRGAPADDSVRLAREARRAQGAFEGVRRSGLPTERDGGAPVCDARVGRLCYWIDDAEPPVAPPEPRRTRDARAQLVSRLESIAGAIPGDAWVAGQLVRYLAESDRIDDALAAARRCTAGVPWCGALEGYALHVGGRYAAADSAFARALERMDPAERCRWLDLGEVLEDDVARRYARLDCAGRAALAERLWRVATPLYLAGANDLRTELLARQVRVRIEAYARGQRPVAWGDDLRELTVRYGWPTWFARSLPPPGSMMEPSITGHDPGPGFTFFPAAAALDSPATARAEAWATDRRPGRMRYAPAWLRALRPLPHQLAIFPRGDSALVAVRYDVTGDTTFADRPLEGGVFVLGSGEPAGARRSGLGRRGALMATVPLASGVAGVELFDSAGRAAARARYGVDVAERARRGISDLLLFDAGEGAARGLDSALARALAGGPVPRATVLGVYWELAPTAERSPAAVTLAVEPIERRGIVRRVGQTLHLTRDRSAVRMAWADELPASDAPAARSVALHVERLLPGRYTMRLTVAPRGGAPRTATREITIAR